MQEHDKNNSTKNRNQHEEERGGVVQEDHHQQYQPVEGCIFNCSYAENQVTSEVLSDDANTVEMEWGSLSGEDHAGHGRTSPQRSHTSRAGPPKPMRYSSAAMRVISDSCLLDNDE